MSKSIHCFLYAALAAIPFLHVGLHDYLESAIHVGLAITIVATREGARADRAAAKARNIAENPNLPIVIMIQTPCGDDQG